LSFIVLFNLNFRSILKLF